MQTRYRIKGKHPAMTQAQADAMESLEKAGVQLDAVDWDRRALESLEKGGALELSLEEDVAMMVEQQREEPSVGSHAVTYSIKFQNKHIRECCGNTHVCVCFETCLT